MKKLENDCLDILIYSSKQRGRWVTLTELSNERNIPPSTIRTIFEICKNGVFIKKDKNKCVVKADVFDKIAKKYRFDYTLKKMKNARGRTTWQISVVSASYNNN